MRKIGKQVFFGATSKTILRNGEGSFARLKDGRIMYAYTQYYGDDWTDHATARIAAIYSFDEGETWSSPVVLIEKEETDLNIMSVSLLTLQNGDLLLGYARKKQVGEEVLCQPAFRRSTDDGKSWSEPIFCQNCIDGYFCTTNDRLIQLKNGRIFTVVAEKGKVIFCYSDDNGQSWQTLPIKLSSPYTDWVQLQEPGMLELPDGRLWVWMRTSYGFQYQAFSSDNGDTWTTPMPNFAFSSPESPMNVKHVDGHTIAVFNPFGYSCASDKVEVWGSPKRTPFVCAVSKDGGSSFVVKDRVPSDGGMKEFSKNCYLLEDDTTNSYCYPSIIDVKNGFLVAYYHSNNTPVCLNSMKIVKVDYAELTE